MAKPTKLTKESADQMLKLLASDDSYRALFKKDVKAALAKVGAKGVDPECLRCVRRLASKERIKAAHVQIRSALTSDNLFTVFKLDSYYRA